MQKLKAAEDIASQRLRKTFKYPSDSDDEDAIENGMDKQDQETLLHTLSARDTSTTHTYTLLLLILPLAPLPFYLPRLASWSTSLPSLAAMTSLLATAYTLYFLPLPPTDTDTEPEIGEPRNGKSVPPLARRRPVPQRAEQRVPFLSAGVAELLAGHLVTVNRAVCGVLALYEVWVGGTWMQGLRIGGGFLPGVICMVILYARTELRGIDVEGQVRRGEGDARLKGR